VKNTLSRSVAAATLVGVSVAAAFAGVTLRGQRVAAMPRLLEETPNTLEETGLFALPSMPFTPQYPLWSDGATKRRWLYLPPGASIDASNADAWQFPLGTRVWKEFSFAGRKVETRFMDLRADGWHYATYIWNADETAATLAPTKGATAVEIAPGVHHRIPSEADCRACHASSPTPVLAFSALQLSEDRDPNAPHREALTEGAVTLRGLVAAGAVKNLPAPMTLVPPRIPGDTTTRAALGYLHANCGGCHRADGALASVGMMLAHSVVHPGDAQRTTFDVASRFMAPRVRIAPGAHADSVLYKRISARTPTEQMPPLGTQLVDAEAQRLIAAWIDQQPQ
jgi:hypothetical protein